MRLLISKIGILSGAVMLAFGSIIFVVAPVPSENSRLSGLILTAIGISTLLSHLSKYFSLTSTREMNAQRRYVYVSNEGPKVEPIVTDNIGAGAAVPLFYCDAPDTSTVSLQKSNESFPFLTDDRVVRRRHSYIESLHKNDALIDTH